MQIFERVANILEPLELEALESIDQFIQGRLANPVGDPLIPALSIRRLMLHYRRIATRYRASRDGDSALVLYLFYCVLTRSSSRTLASTGSAKVRLVDPPLRRRLQRNVDPVPQRLGHGIAL